jgi:DNA-binding IscR family transcriptional regulator
MSEHTGPLTSSALAKAMDTNPVVVRRVMSGLREQNYVRSEKGHGGGWTLAPGWERITLRDIYDALGEPSVIAIGNRTESPDCLVEQAVNAALGKAFADRGAASQATGANDFGSAQRRISLPVRGAAPFFQCGHRTCLLNKPMN